MTVPSYKHLGLVTKHPATFYDDFVAYWQGPHADLAKTLPGLRKYVINPIDRRVYPDSPIDGVAELWFDSQQDAETAWASEAGCKTHADGVGFFATMAVTDLYEITIL